MRIRLPFALLFSATIAAVADVRAFAMVGGAAQASLETARFVVFIVGTKHSCTGVLIRPEIVLTSAQCVMPNDEYKVTGFGGFVSSVMSITRHPRFDRDAALKRQATADLALLNLENAAGSRLASATIATASRSIKTDDRYEVAGYGVAAENTASGAVLRTAVLAVAGRTDSGALVRLVDPMTAGQRPGVGACLGDFGAPVFDARWGKDVVVVGIVTWASRVDGSAGCGGITAAVLLAPYRDWIEKTATSLASRPRPPKRAAPAQASRIIPKPPEPRSQEPSRISTGSGFVATPVGHVLTNAHVVRECTSIRVNSVGLPAANATLLAQTTADDIAILKTDMRPRQVAKLRSSPALRPGEPIVVFGFPLSGLLSSTGNATTGNISALAGLRNDPRHLQISAPVQPGNSGGPLVDMHGHVVGMVVAKLDAIRFARVTQDIPQNINFAIKASVVANFLDANGIRYSSSQDAQELSVPDVVERARSFSVEVKCQK